MVQLSHPYMTTGKTMALTIWTFADKVISLLFNMLPRFVIAFLPRSFWFPPPQAVSHSLRPSLLIPTPCPCLLTLRRRMFCFFKQAWAPISFSLTWYSLVATVVSHLALLLIWSEVIKEIILTQLHFPEFPEVASSAPCLYFLFQINFVLTLKWDRIWWACCVDFHENKAGLCISIPTRAPTFF